MDTATADPTAPTAATLDELLTPLLPAAYRLAVSLTRDRADAEDLVQDAALNACRGFARFNVGTNFKAWFFKIVYHCFVSRYRRQRRAGTVVSIDATDRPDELELESGWSASEPDPLAQLLGRIDTADILRAIESLPDEYRTVAALYFVDDLSYQDIADVVGTPIGTVRSRLHRSRAALKAVLRQLAVERGLVAA